MELHLLSVGGENGLRLLMNMARTHYFITDWTEHNIEDAARPAIWCWHREWWTKECHGGGEVGRSHADSLPLLCKQWSDMCIVSTGPPSISILPRLTPCLSEEHWQWKRRFSPNTQRTRMWLKVDARRVQCGKFTRHTKPLWMTELWSYFDKFAEFPYNLHWKFSFHSSVNYQCIEVTKLAVPGFVVLL